MVLFQSKQVAALVGLGLALCLAFPGTAFAWYDVDPVVTGETVARQYAPSGIWELDMFGTGYKSLFASVGGSSHILNRTTGSRYTYPSYLRWDSAGTDLVIGGTDAYAIYDMYNLRNEAPAPSTTEGMQLQGSTLESYVRINTIGQTIYSQGGYWNSALRATCESIDTSQHVWPGTFPRTGATLAFYRVFATYWDTERSTRVWGIRWVESHTTLNRASASGVLSGKGAATVKYEDSSSVLSPGLREYDDDPAAWSTSPLLVGNFDADAQIVADRVVSGFSIESTNVAEVMSVLGDIDSPFVSGETTSSILDRLDKLEADPFSVGVVPPVMSEEESASAPGPFAGFGSWSEYAKDQLDRLNGPIGNLVDKWFWWLDALGCWGVAE